MGVCTSNYSELDKNSKSFKNNQLKSTIITQQQTKEIFKNKILKKITYQIKNKIHLKMLFRASASQYSAQKFHDATDGIKNTILLVKTVRNRIFGAYTSCQWKKNQNYKYQQDQENKTFIFRIYRQNQNKSQKNSSDEKTKLNGLACDFYSIIDQTKAIMNNRDNGPIFGQGYDIFINDQCHVNSNWCNIGKTYQCVHPFGSNKANQLLAGQKKFLILDYQIWQLETIKN